MCKAKKKKKKYVENEETIHAARCLSYIYTYTCAERSKYLERDTINDSTEQTEPNEQIFEVNDCKMIVT